MKRHSFTMIAAILAAAGFVSCSFMGLEPGKKGSISIEIPAWVLESSRTAAAAESSRAVGGTIGFARVYLEANGSLIQLDGQKPYLEKAISATDNTIEIDEIQPQKYILYLSLGAAGGDDFRASVYASSAVFTVSAGSTADVEVTKTDSVFADKSIEIDTANGVRVAVVNGTVYTLAKGTLKWGTSETADLSAIGAIGLGVGRELLSDGTFGGEVLWINTVSEGVRQFDPVNKTYGADFTGVSGKGYGAKAKILESGVLNLLDQEGTTLEVAYYQRAGSVGFGTENVGGTVEENEITGWDWRDLYEEFDDPENDLSDLKDLIEDLSSKLIADFHTSADYGYVLIPAINNFRVYAALEDDLDALEDEFDLLGQDPEYNDYLDVVKGGDAEGNVLKVADGAGTRQSVSQEGTHLFIGTKTGLFNTTVDGNGVPAGAAAKIGAVRKADGTNSDIVRVRSKTVGADVWTAALARNGDLFLLKNAAFVKMYRFHTGLPSFTVAGNTDAGIHGDILWTGDGLMVSGVNGAVLLQNADLGN